MLNKNDPLIGPVQEIMKRSQLEREAVKAVNEKFGVYDRKALPHEKQSEWDAAYKQVLSEGTENLSPKQKKLAAIAGNPKKIDASDLAAARKGHASHIEEGDESKAIRGDVQTGGSSVSTVATKPATTSVTPSDQAALKKKIQSIKEAKLEEKAVSKAQHRFFGLVRGIQKGKTHGSAKAEKAAATMSAKSVKDYAKTSEKGLPEKVSEALDSGDRGQIRSQTQYGGAGGARPMPAAPRNAATGTQSSTGASVGGARPAPAAPRNAATGTQSSTGSAIGGARPSSVAKNTGTGTQPSTGAQIGGARPSPSVGGNAGSLTKMAQGQRTSNAIKNLNTPGLRTTNKVNAAGQTKGPNVGLTQKSTVASTGEKASVATQTKGPNAAMGQRPAASAAVAKPTAKPAGLSKPAAAKPAAKLTPVKKPMSQAQRSYVARQKERHGP